MLAHSFSTVLGTVTAVESEGHIVRIAFGIPPDVIEEVSDILTENGYYVTPAIVMGLDEEHDLNNMDSALPILSVQVVEDVDQAIDIINCTEYGMCAGVITKDQAFAERFLDEINADEVFINDPSNTIGVASRALVANFMD